MRISQSRNKRGSAWRWAVILLIVVGANLFLSWSSISHKEPPPKIRASKSVILLSHSFRSAHSFLSKVWHPSLNDGSTQLLLAPYNVGAFTDIAKNKIRIPTSDPQICFPKKYVVHMHSEEDQFIVPDVWELYRECAKSADGSTLVFLSDTLHFTGGIIGNINNRFQPAPLEAELEAESESGAEFERKRRLSENSDAEAEAQKRVSSWEHFRDFMEFCHSTLLSGGDESLAILAPRVLNSDGKTIYSAGLDVASNQRFGSTVMHHRHSGMPWYYATRSVDDSFKEWEEVEAVSSQIFAMRRSTLEHLAPHLMSPPAATSFDHCTFSAHLSFLLKSKAKKTEIESEKTTKICLGGPCQGIATRTHVDPSPISDPHRNSISCPRASNFMEKWHSHMRNLIEKRQILKSHVFVLNCPLSEEGFTYECLDYLRALESRVDTVLVPLRYNEQWVNRLPTALRELCERVVVPSSHFQSSVMGHKYVVLDWERNEWSSLWRNAELKLDRSMYESVKLPYSYLSMRTEASEHWSPSHFVGSVLKAHNYTKEIYIMQESVDTDLLDPYSVEPLYISSPKSFNFLSVFKFEKRKGWDTLLKAFFAEFGPHEDVCLILRCPKVFELGMHTYDQDNRVASEKVKERIANWLIQDIGLTPEDFPSLPCFHVLGGDLSLTELPKLYAAADAFVLPTHGEGWGRPAQDAMAMGLPVIATNWSGLTDFVIKEWAYPIPVESVDQWAQISALEVQRLMRHVFTHQQEARQKGKLARQKMRQHFDANVIVEKALGHLAQSLAKQKQRDQKDSSVKGQKSNVRNFSSSSSSTSKTGSTKVSREKTTMDIK